MAPSILWLLLPSYAIVTVLGLSSGRTALPNAAGPIVDLGYARYQGYTDYSMNISSFIGIRYAAPPTGIAFCTLVHE